MKNFKVYQQEKWFQNPWVVQIDEYVSMSGNLLEKTSDVGYRYYGRLKPRDEIIEWCNTVYGKKDSWFFGANEDPALELWSTKFYFYKEEDATMFVLKWS